MALDADERVERGALDALAAMPDDPSTAGYFGTWTNHVDGLAPFDDYKLFLFRNGLLPRGLVHDVAQHDIRTRGLRARWLAQLVVHHFPDPERRRAKAASYRERLQCAIAREPAFWRYHWFLGYMDFLDARFDDAIDWLGRAAGACSREFPVECLNSAMVLADVRARRGERALLRRTLARGSRQRGRTKRRARWTRSARIASRAERHATRPPMKRDKSSARTSGSVAPASNAAPRATTNPRDECPPVRKYGNGPMRPTRALSTTSVGDCSCHSTIRSAGGPQSRARGASRVRITSRTIARPLRASVRPPSNSHTASQTTRKSPGATIPLASRPATLMRTSPSE
jgi:hypothetical protein